MYVLWGNLTCVWWGIWTMCVCVVGEREGYLSACRCDLNCHLSWLTKIYWMECRVHVNSEITCRIRGAVVRLSPPTAKLLLIKLFITDIQVIAHLDDFLVAVFPFKRIETTESQTEKKKAWNFHQRNLSKFQDRWFMVCHLTVQKPRKFTFMWEYHTTCLTTLTDLLRIYIRFLWVIQSKN